MNAPHEPAAGAAVQTLADVAASYLAAYAGRDESRYQRVNTWVRLLGDKPLAAITPEDIDAAMATLASEPARVYAGLDADEKPIYRKKDGGRSGATLNRYLVALGALFTWARRNRLVPRGFESPTKHIEKRTESRGRVRYLSKDERERLLTACQASGWPRLYLLVLMALTTGARRGELLGLRWKDVDLDRGEAAIGTDVCTETKNGDARCLILLPQVAAELERFAPKDAAKSDTLVFRSRLRPSQPYATAEAFRDAMKAAGIKDFRFHDCRHTAASYMAQSGASLLEIADTLGHRQLRMVQRYAHLNTDSRRRLMTRVFEGRL
ncbi:MAG: tyrosine-type recombinase/integrase [Sulfuritalea sp.]|nr:tyrosine-type recombinase/integrase [Sulfuritalea sp.]